MVEYKQSLLQREPRECLSPSSCSAFCFSFLVSKWFNVATRGTAKSKGSAEDWIRDSEVLEPKASSRVSRLLVTATRPQRLTVLRPRHDLTARGRPPFWWMDWRRIRQCSGH